MPFDDGYVGCNCAVGTGSIRHERVLAAQGGSGAATVRDLSQSAHGALIALEAGERELAARLLSDLLAKSAQSDDPAPPKEPRSE
jgi:hypothetical protein